MKDCSNHAPDFTMEIPFELIENKPGYVVPEPPACHFVEIRDEQVVVYSRLFLHSEPSINSCTCYYYQPDHFE